MIISNLLRGWQCFLVAKSFEFLKVTSKFDIYQATHIQDMWNQFYLQQYSLPKYKEKLWPYSHRAKHWIQTFILLYNIKVRAANELSHQFLVHCQYSKKKRVVIFRYLRNKLFYYSLIKWTSQVFPHTRTFLADREPVTGSLET